MASTIHGPIISTRDLDAHAALLGPVFGMECMAEDYFDPRFVERLWGVARRSARTKLYQTPGTNTGIRLIEFSPTPSHSIRDPAHGNQHDALKVIDFHVPDFRAAVARLENAGFPLSQKIVEYEMVEGHFREAHLWAEDAVVYALIGGPHEFMGNMVQVSDGTFSEVMSISSPVTRRDHCIEFYSRVFGLEVIYRYGFSDQGFADLVGNLDELQLTGINIGRCLQDPFFGLIEYGAKSSMAVSLATECNFTKRGIVGASIHVDDLDQVVAQCQGSKDLIVAGPADCELPPYGHTRSAVVRGPHGVLHHALELPQS